MVGVIVPGGFEKLFFLLGENTTTATHSPYVPADVADAVRAGSSAEFLATLEALDV